MDSSAKSPKSLVFSSASQFAHLYTLLSKHLLLPFTRCAPKHWTFSIFFF